MSLIGRSVVQFIETVNSGGIKDFESCELAIEAYRKVFEMEVGEAIMNLIGWNYVDVLSLLELEYSGHDKPLCVVV